MGELEILDAGALTLVQDRGRVGFAHLGVPRAGALDAPAAALANRLVGNDPDAAILEITMGGLAALNAGPARWAALTGAQTDETALSRTVGGPSRPARAHRAAVAHAAAFWWPQGTVLSVGRPVVGVRTYLAISGGIHVAPVLGSRSTDTLAWVGPARVQAGARLPLGEWQGLQPNPLDTPPARRVERIRLMNGPQAAWFAESPADRTWTVRAASDRVGMRLDGPPLARLREGELPSEGMVLGAVQVPPDGRPIVFLADHPPTGGYPVIGVVHPDDLWQCAQLRPGEQVRFRDVATRNG
ncbi:biotin-dependent carboxyltransferase family protein [Nocardioides sp. Kera G14]|uniref:5-oxoprolinase subunit C family protein n=1 Tax=Nocardioides sp. Kera G14 TaxID=2884264 RepID=UPI001D0F60D4|nr:biotin-dependent carboxyltransferase family protein [Nocardioides sp. Kera G14]UDY22409.1 biotin-dependent carboxyltransferase family protein [Nocardioides sp. Kera G14]